MTSAYPLSWPKLKPRRPASARRRSTFATAKPAKQSADRNWRQQKPLTIADALDRLASELAMMKAQSIVISSNVSLRYDGFPRSGEREPEDPAVAVYFDMAGKQICMPCDTFDRVADNLAAVAAHIRATRAIERYGVGTLAELFSGFAMLAPPDARRPSRNWWDVLECRSSATRDTIEMQFRRLAKERHPDTGGSSDQMSELNEARRRGLEANV